jgi:hypothetical protein
VRLADHSPCTTANTCLGNLTCASGVCTGIDLYCSGVCGDGIKAQQEQWYLVLLYSF